MDCKLKNYYDLVVPAKLVENEYVRILCINKDKTLVKTLYVKTFEEFHGIILRYRFNWNLFMGAATVLGNEEAKEENMCRRQILFFDFDKKDFPQFQRVQDFSEHFKRKGDTLFNHAIIDSGNGYHFIVATEVTDDIDRITKLNKDLAQYLEADTKATSPTQVMRIPTSLNLKTEIKKPVSIVNNTYGTVRYKPYKLNRIEQIARFLGNNQSKDNPNSDKPIIQFNEEAPCFCVQKMLAEGCDIGERNFALGRITKNLQLKGNSYDMAMKKVLDWNSRCRPPKSKSEIEVDFKNYWNGDYKLLGCTLENESDQRILAKYCDKYNCKSLINGETRGIVVGKELVINNKLLENKLMRKMSGYHYLIMTILHIHEKGLSYKQIKKEITSSKTKKPCMSDNTFRKVMTELEKWKYITGDKTLFKLRDIPNYGAGYTRYYYAASLMLINRIINQTSYKVYLGLVRNLQLRKPVTFAQLSDDLDMDGRNIGTYIQELHESGILKIEKNHTDKGYTYNRYILIA